MANDERDVGDFTAAAQPPGQTKEAPSNDAPSNDA